MHRVLQGQVDIRELSQTLGALVAPAGSRALDETMSSLVVGVLVELVGAGAAVADSSGRDSILRPALERCPELWASAVEHFGTQLGREFARSWENVRMFLRYSVLDPTVPAWAQRAVIDMVFTTIGELASEGREDEALIVLEWAAEVAADIGQPEKSSTGSDMVYYMQGRSGPLQILVLCTRASERLSGSESINPRLQRVVDSLRLLAASLVYRDQRSNANSVRCDTVQLAHVQKRLLAVLMNACQHSSAEAASAAVDAVVWAVAAHRVVAASVREEQALLLDVIEALCNSSGMSVRMRALMRLPLLSVAADGFTSAIRQRAFEISGSLDWESVERDSNEAFCGQAFDRVSGELPLLISGLQRYTQAWEAVECVADDQKSTNESQDAAVQALDALDKQPLLVAPFVFAESNAVARVAVGALLGRVDEQPALRLHVLALFASVLRRKDTHAELRHALIVHAVPRLAANGDAHATARVVALVAAIWQQDSGRVGGNAGQGRHAGRVGGMAVRAWARVVARSPRVWRDLSPVVVQLAEALKARRVVAREYAWAVLVTVRDLAARDAARYADHVLPLVFALLRYAGDVLDECSTALLVDAARLCVEAGTAEARGVWAVVERVAGATGAARDAVARMVACVGAHGEPTEVYALFRQSVLARFVERETDTDWLAKIDANALAAFPTDEVLPLISGPSPAQTIQTLNGSGAALLARLMDHEVRFMRRSVLTGGAAARAPDSGPVSWAQANRARAQWVQQALDLPLQRAHAAYWTGGGGAGSALAALIGADSVEQPAQGQLSALLSDAAPADHWTLRCAAAEAWQVWFAQALRGIDAAAVLAELLAELHARHVPARVENALYAVSGLVRAVQATDAARAAELAMRAAQGLRAARLQPDDALWTDGSGDGVAGAALECAAHVACATAHDDAVLSATAQALVSAVVSHQLPPATELAAARALARVFAALAARPVRHAGAGEIEIEADDLRRSVERLNVLNGEGRVALPVALALMHRHWLERALDPARADANQTPLAATAVRTVARTLRDALARLQAEDTAPARRLASLFYLCFVWPPRPIQQRHVELHADLLTVTPDRVWPACMRLTRAMWTQGAVADTAGLVEIAVATLASHLALTAGQAASHTQLVREYSAWARGASDEHVSTAAEKQQLRASRICALGVLLGVPMHGVPETSVSNAYLPLAQQQCLPVLLGVGSVQYGSTTWLRLPEPALHEALGSLVRCAGLSEDADAEIDDPRAARVASFVLAVLAAQAQRTEQLLALDSSTQDAEAADKDVEADIMDMTSEEPRSLGHLPAQTSWCRAVWEAICELAESAGSAGTGSADSSETDYAGETQLLGLLRALLLAERPFPAVDAAPVLRRILDTQLARAESVDRRLPVLALLLQVAIKLSPVVFSVAQFLDDAVVLVASKASALAVETGCDWRVNTAHPDSLLAVALACVDGGLARLLALSGMAGLSEIEACALVAGEVLDEGWMQAQAPGSRFTSTDVVRIIGSPALFSDCRLRSAVRLPEPEPREDAVESDAQRMFRLMSRVAMSAPKAAVLCSRLLEVLFGRSERSPALLVLQLQALATLRDHVANAATVDMREVSRETARAKITQGVSDLLDQQPCALVLWGAVGVSYCGANETRGRALLATDLQQVAGDALHGVLRRQALVLQRWAGEGVDVGTETGGWLKRVFKEWARRCAVARDAGLDAVVAECLAGVAMALHRAGKHLGERAAQGWIVQTLDLAILALSILRGGADASGADSVVCTGLLSWLLPLLTGRGGSDACMLSVAAAVLIKNIETDAAPAGRQNMRQYSVLLRTRVVALLDLATTMPVRRCLLDVLVHLAMTGKLPEADLWRVAC
ncbi:hypothetical protein IWW50_001087 [Coemansia erecta]|nr:hypothetical protein IWW50_001087 [Coemansia erecta]